MEFKINPGKAPTVCALQRMDLLAALLSSAHPADVVVNRVRLAMIMYLGLFSLMIELLPALRVLTIEIFMHMAARAIYLVDFFKKLKTQPFSRG